MLIIKFIFQFVAVIACGLFAGASVYINLVEHPARMECGTALAAAVFGPSYRRATVMQASLAAIGSIAAFFVWANGGRYPWLIGAGLLFAVIPFTLLVIMPTNRKLLAPHLDRASPQTHALLMRWAQLHAVRSVLSVSAFAVFVFQVVQRSFQFSG